MNPFRRCIHQLSAAPKSRRAHEKHTQFHYDFVCLFRIIVYSLCVKIVIVSDYNRKYTFFLLIGRKSKTILQVHAGI